MKKVEYCDPFDRKKVDYFIKLEHCGRYVFARDFILKKNLATVLDIACANGYGTEILAKVCDKIIGVDKNDKYLKIARKRKIKNANFVLFDINSNILENEKVDLIVSFETIEHIENTKNFMKSIQSNLKKGGYLLLSVPNEKYEQLDQFGNIIYPYHKHIFSKKEIINLLNEYGFEIISILGQSLSNMIVSNEHTIKHGMQDLYDKKFLSRRRYSKCAIIMNSYIYAYPCDTLIDKSYSYIYLCKFNGKL